MTILQAIILGIVQGLTEFLPVSSSGHLLIVPWLFNWHFLLENPDLNKTFDVALHFGTFISLVVYFWRDIGRLLAAWVRTIAHRKIDSTDGKLAWLIIVSMVPAAIVGVAFEDVIVEVLGKPWMLAVLMIAFGGVMWAADRYARHERELDKLGWKDAALIGAAQALALSPGVSRSGVTMVTGLFLRLTREAAARFSFLMSIPIVGGAALYKGLEVAQEGLPAGTQTPFLAGMIAAAVSGFAAIWFLLAYLRKHDFTIFVIYRFAIGLGMIILIVTGVRSGMGI
jgi:undecaprenyl-diphosphatase